MSHGLFEIHDDETNVDDIVNRIQERVRARPDVTSPAPHGLVESHDDEIDVDQIMDGIRERARTRTDAAPAAASTQAAAPPQVPPQAAGWSRAQVPAGLQRDLDSLRTNWDPTSLLPERTRLRWLKRCMLWAMSPFTRGQATFNAGVVWVTFKEVERVSALVEAVQALETAVRQQQDELRSRLVSAERRDEEVFAIAEGRAVRLSQNLDEVVSSSQDRFSTLEKCVAELRLAADRAAALEGRVEELRVAADRAAALEGRVEELRVVADRAAALEGRVEELRLAADRAGGLEQWTEEFRLAAEGKLRESLSAIEAREVALGRRHEALRQEVLLQKRRLELILLEIRQKAGIDAEVATQLAAHEEELSDHIAFLHEQFFRGTDDDLRERMEIYVPLFTAARERVGGDAFVLDIGPGRGTLLELLRQAGIPARGADLNEDMVQVCQEKGLAVTKQNGLDFLSSLPDDSLLGVTALHVVEHLTTAELMEFVKLCHDKIRRGGLLVLETPNPTNLLTAATEFHMDLTHRRPIHPLALAYLVEALGFVGIETKTLHPPPAELQFRLTTGATGDLAIENENWTRLNGLLFGPRDYAVIASR